MMHAQWAGSQSKCGTLVLFLRKGNVPHNIRLDCYSNKNCVSRLSSQFSGKFQV